MEKRRQKYLAALTFVVMTAIVPTVGSHVTAGRNYYISLIIAAVAFIPVFLIILRLCDLCGKRGNVFEYFGGKCSSVGKVLAAICAVYALFSGFTTLRIMGEEIKNLALFESPMIYVFAFAFALYLYAVNKDYRVFGHFSAIYIPILAVGAVAYIVFSVNRYEWGNIEPVFLSDAKGIAISSVGSVTGLFGDSALLLFVAGMRNENEKREPLRKRYFFIAYGAAFAVIFSTAVNSLLVLGGEAATKLYFPHYISASLISLGFVTRPEIVLNVLYFIEMNIKIIFCLYCAVKGIEYIFPVKKSRRSSLRKGISLAVCAAVCIGAAYIFSSTRDFFVYLRYYRFFGATFMVIPIILWIVAEIIERRDSITVAASGKLNPTR